MSQAPPPVAEPVVAGQRLKLPIRDERVSDLLLWRDPIKSGIAIFAITALYSFITYAKFNALVVTSYTLLAVVVGSFLWNSYASFANKAPVPVPALLARGVSEDEVKVAAEKGTIYLNKALGFLKRLFLARDPVATGETAGVLYSVARVAAITSPITVLYGATLAAFSLPKIYELRKPQIDQVLATVRVHATKLYDQYLSRFVTRIPRASTAEPIEIIEDALDKKDT